MVGEILTGISMKLNQVFEGCEIYGDSDVVQGLIEPCFFIAVLNPSQTKLIGQRYFREHPFNVQYFPKEAGDNAELHDVASDLFETLEYITLLNGDLVHGTSMAYEIVDGILHFFVQFNMFVNKVVESEPMETLTVNNDVEG